MIEIQSHVIVKIDVIMDYKKTHLFDIFGISINYQKDRLEKNILSSYNLISLICLSVVLIWF